MKIILNCPYCGGSDLHSVNINSFWDVVEIKCTWHECEKFFKVHYDINVITSKIEDEIK